VLLLVTTIAVSAADALCHCHRRAAGQQLSTLRRRIRTRCARARARLGTAGTCGRCSLSASLLQLSAQERVAVRRRAARCRRRHASLRRPASAANGCTVPVLLWQRQPRTK
jgi:hypothetical protein